MNVDSERLAKGLYWQRSWKLVEGCTKVSPGCENCWSETETAMRSFQSGKVGDRASRVVLPSSTGRTFDGSITMRHDNLNLPLRIKKPTVFAIWNDLYHKDVTAAFLKKAYQVMSDCPHHTFLVLTKRAERMAECCQGDIGRPENESHIYHGVTVCNQEEADKNIPLLLQVPGKRFLSIEPMLLGPIKFNTYHLTGRPCFVCKIEDELGEERGTQSHPINCGYRQDIGQGEGGIDQVLLGGESGKNARPMHPEWVRTIRDQCESAGVPFMFKQQGEWIECQRPYNHSTDVVVWPNGQTSGPNYTDEYLKENGGVVMRRVGKKKAGRTLDGKLHDDLIWVSDTVK